MNLKEKLIGKLELPSDAVLGDVRITITGSREVHIENCKSIAEYTPELVRIGTTGGIIKICGKGITIKSAQSDEITLCGKIDGVELV